MEPAGARSVVAVPEAEVVAPASYPRELQRTVTLRDGTIARIRAIRPDDEPRLVNLYERLSR